MEFPNSNIIYQMDFANSKQIIQSSSCTMPLLFEQASFFQLSVLQNRRMSYCLHATQMTRSIGLSSLKQMALTKLQACVASLPSLKHIQQSKPRTFLPLPFLPQVLIQRKHHDRNRRPYELRICDKFDWAYCSGWEIYFKFCWTARMNIWPASALSTSFSFHLRRPPEAYSDVTRVRGAPIIWILYYNMFTVVSYNTIFCA